MKMGISLSCSRGRVPFSPVRKEAVACSAGLT